MYYVVVIQSASYGDRNQGGAIFYYANTEKGGPISFIHGKRSFFVSQWFFSGLQNAHCLLMVPKRETIVQISAYISYTADEKQGFIFDIVFYS